MTKIGVLIASLFISACGRDLELDPRQEWKTDEIVQNYEVDVFYSEIGFTYYVARAILATEPEYGSKSMQLPTCDKLTMNGVTLTWSELDQDYRSSGTDLPTGFAFVWTHAALSYNNSITPSSYPATSMPSVISKAQGLTLSIPGLPSSIQAIANVNSGFTVKAPFHALPIEVDGALQDVHTDLSTLSAGPGVLTLLETTEGVLQNKTAAGGSLTLKVQYGYNITIED